MDKRTFIKRSVASAVAIGATGKLSSGLAGENRTERSENRTGNREIRRKLGKTGFDVFPVVYGGIVSRRDGQDASDNYVAWARDRGINYFDVAPTYGDAQEKLGNSLKPYRKEVYLACKTTQRSRTEAEKEFEESLRLLHTDYFDLYQLHALTAAGDVDQAFAASGVMEMIEKEKQRGRIRKVGFSAHSQVQALRAMTMYDFDTVMFPLNWQMDMLAGWGSGVVHEAKRRGMGVIALKGLVHRRWLNDEERKSYPKSWVKPIDVADPELGIAALKYTLRAGADIIVPPGDFRNFAFCVDHIGEIVEKPLSRREKNLLDREFLAVKEYPFFDPKA
ncbi:MAG: aldo/keto reductase [bacterium]|nr:aldo/keto reductase [bacterium]MDD3624680.1 aldo/keto reductase [Proteiniphilum sp.]MDD3967809.1 aldo/keto reductase [Proteiniphilum sp.]MDD4458237.1 aldo/keto reductase [Proteiniphilum sp.]